MPSAIQTAAEIPLSDIRLCTIDIETTGIGNSDRIVELALVVTDASGSKEREFHTIVDPGISLASMPGGGASWAHGLTDADLVGAPTMSELTPTVLDHAGGTVIAAHGAPFVLRMLQAEFVRNGETRLSAPFVCTKTLRTRVGLDGPGNKSLEWHCWQEGIPLLDTNATVIEARAVAKLAARYLEVARTNGIVSLGDIKSSDSAAKSWKLPLLPISGSYTPLAAKERSDIPIEPAGLTPRDKVRARQVNAYRKVLSAAMTDFELTADESRRIQNSARKLVLSAGEIKVAHEAHLEELIAEQASDKVITWAEQQQTLLAASLLAISGERLQEMLSAHDVNVEGEVADVSSTSQLEGISVCFTGPFTAMPMTRSEVEELAASHGLVPRKGVSASLDILVCRDPSAGTSKLRNAERLGTIVISQQLFLAVIGSMAAGPGEVSGLLSRLSERRQA